MGNAGAHEAQRRAAQARWGTRVLDRAVETVVSRSGQLDGSQREALLGAAGVPQNEAWGRAFARHRDRAAERAASRARVDALLTEAELASAVKRGDTAAVMELIARLARGPAETRQD